jgi:hypothetical protein
MARRSSMSSGVKESRRRFIKSKMRPTLTTPKPHRWHSISTWDEEDSVAANRRHVDMNVVVHRRAYVVGASLGVAVLVALLEGLGNAFHHETTLTCDVE